MRPNRVRGIKDMSINNATPAEWDKASRDSSLRDEDTILPDHYDPVNPPHYKSEGVECIDYIKQQLSRDAYVGYLEGNVIKYIHRHKYKNGLEDLRKAQWYLEKLAQATIDGGNR
tara:strand:+ start:377 stop:721 length:345 start_codon:yes stop_codon:yes gene_type:complete